jgi:hypothetical protein
MEWNYTHHASELCDRMQVRLRHHQEVLCLVGITGGVLLQMLQLHVLGKLFFCSHQLLDLCTSDLQTNVGLSEHAASLHVGCKASHTVFC